MYQSLAQYLEEQKKKPIRAKFKNGTGISADQFPGFLTKERIEVERAKLSADLKQDVVFVEDDQVVYEDGEDRRTGNFVFGETVIWSGNVFQMRATAEGRDAYLVYTGVNSPGHWEANTPGGNNLNAIKWVNAPIIKAPETPGKPAGDTLFAAKPPAGQDEGAFTADDRRMLKQMYEAMKRQRWVI